MIEVNKLYNECHLITMSNMPDNFIDMALTSPPYDDLRTYNGFTFNFESCAHELYRVLKPGGVLVWVIKDAIVNGSRSLTSYKHAIYFVEMCGFRLHDDMIWEKRGMSAPCTNRYHDVMEYMFVFSKGAPKTFNPIQDRKNIYAGKMAFGKNSRRNPDGSIKPANQRKEYGEYGKRTNIWRMKTAGQERVCQPRSDDDHPAPFSEELAESHILTWTNHGYVVYDPMCGSGTACAMAAKLGRKFIGSEVSEQYCIDARKRIEPYLNQTTIFDMISIQEGGAA